MKLTIKGKEYEPKFGIGFIGRTIKEDKPDGNNIMEVATQRLLFHSLAYADERNGLEPTLSMFDIYDFLDEIGINAPEIRVFQVEFFKSMRVHLPDDESKNEIDKVIKALTPDEKKKDSKSGKKTGK